MTLGQFGTHLQRCGFRYPVLERTALRGVADSLALLAQSYLGQYQPASPPYGPWAPLADFTVRDRVARGYPPDEPLLRTGELRDSISGRVDGRSAVIGSGSRIAFWQELGTSRMPARPFLGRAVAQRGEPAARRVIYLSLRPLLTGR